MSNTLRRAAIALVVTIGPSLASVFGVLGDAMNLRHLLYVDAPLHDGRLSDAEDTVIARAFQEYSADPAAQEALPATFEEYLLDQNPEFDNALTRLVDNERSDMIIVHAAGGYGKSALVETVVQDIVGGNSRTIALAEYCAADAERACLSETDLLLDGKTVNSLPYLAREQLESLVDEALSSEVALLVLDGLDEIHLDAAKGLLDILIDRKDSFGATDVVLFSRSELVDEIISRDNTETYVTIQRVALNPHRITQVALPIRVKNYLDYRASRALDTGGAVDDDGDGIIPGTNDQLTVDRVSSSLRDLLSDKQYLVDMLRLAFLSSLLIESQLDGTSLGDNDIDIRQNVLEEVMARAMASHNRPTKADTHYYSALATVALNAEPDADGLFTMRQMLSAPDPEDDGQFQISDPYLPLRRSGLVSFIPAERYARVRFEPVWLQSALVYKANREVRTISYRRVAVAVGVIVALGFVVFAVQPRSKGGLRSARRGNAAERSGELT